MTNIFIANLDWSITSEDLKTTFSAFGPVHYAHVVYDKETKKSKGFGYIEMEDADHAINAIQALNGLEVNGRKLDVKIASPKENRPPRKPQTEKPFKKKEFGSGRPDQKRFDNRSGGSRSGGNDQRGDRGGYVKRDNRNKE
jgi:RNA recognition motif-containing protein